MKRISTSKLVPLWQFLRSSSSVLTVILYNRRTRLSKIFAPSYVKISTRHLLLPSLASSKPAFCHSQRPLRLRLGKRMAMSQLLKKLPRQDSLVEVPRLHSSNCLASLDHVCLMSSLVCGNPWQEGYYPLALEVNIFTHNTGIQLTPYLDSLSKMDNLIEKQCGQDVIDSLSVLEAAIPTFHQDLWSTCSQLFPLISLALRSKFAIIRQCASRCFATLCDVMTTDSMHFVIEKIVPYLGDTTNLSNRQGATELVYRKCLILTPSSI